MHFIFQKAKRTVNIRDKIQSAVEVKAEWSTEDETTFESSSEKPASRFNRCKNGQTKV